MLKNCPIGGERWKTVARSRWTFLVFHLALISYCFGAHGHLLPTVLVWLTMQVGVHAGYHRYFAHRSFRTSSWLELLLGLAGCLAFQNGPVWWASRHRRHHQWADSRHDDHSPTLGFYHAHIGWLWDKSVGPIEWQYVGDLQRPIPIWIEHYQLWIHVSYLSIACIASGSLNAVLTLWITPIVICWHTTFSTNSICHLLGTRPYKCNPHDTCMARNNFAVALINLGEGWHNNHHAHPSCTHHGFHRWYQIDLIYCALFILEHTGLIWDLKRLKNPLPLQSGPASREYENP